MIKLIAVVLVFFCALMLLYLFADRKHQKKIKENIDHLHRRLNQWDQFAKELQRLDGRINEWLRVHVESKAKTQKLIDEVQDHLARIREQQQILGRRQNWLRKRYDAIAGAKKKPSPKLMKKIKSQLQELSV